MSTPTCLLKNNAIPRGNRPQKTAAGSSASGQRRCWKSKDTSHTGIHKDLTTTMLQQFPLAKPIIFLITESSLTPKVKKLQLTWLLIITAEMQHKEEMFISADEGGMD